jgi:hypothetical protein
MSTQFSILPTQQHSPGPAAIRPFSPPHPGPFLLPPARGQAAITASLVRKCHAERRLSLLSFRTAYSSSPVPFPLCRIKAKTEALNSTHRGWH